MPERMAVIIIDMLNDFVTGDLKCDRAQRIIPNLKKLVETARKNGVPVIYCNDAHYPGDFEVHRWGLHAVKGTKGAEVIPELKPTKKDFIVEKRTYSGFFETGLDPLLRSLYNGEGVRTVVLGGLHTHICVRHTAADAFFRGYKIIVAKDGVEAFTQEEHEQGLRYLEYVYNAKLMTVDEIIKEVEKGSC
ncbi:MAG: cysteine hydrolase [Candidatus Bathyarchaeota archaeon]|nr:cysteine hydrolase [Candidatus Bathyarchaeota archaeon]MDW8022189.1 isochorismatase family cysteine hydrolase [Nitrososphaerota archaeon]